MNLSKMNRRRSSERVTFGDINYPPGGTFGPRMQQDFQLVILLEGSLRVRVGEVEHTLNEHQAILMLPGRTEFYGFAEQRQNRHSWCAVGVSLVPDGLAEQLGPLAQPFGLSPRVQSLMELGLNFSPSPSPQAQAVLEQLALLILLELAFEASAQEREPAPRAVQKARVYMEAHLREALTLPAVARAVNLTPQHLTRLFRQHLDTTPMRYLWSLRTQRGAALLRETGLSVAAVAEQVGFESPFHFSRLIKRAYGSAPRKLRQSAWQSGGEAE